MTEQSWNQRDCLNNVSAIRQTLFRLPKFCERTRVILLLISAGKVNFWKVRIERKRVVEGILARAGLCSIPFQTLWLCAMER